VNNRIKSILQYIGLFALTCLLLWFSLRSISVAEGENKGEFLWRAWQSSDKLYLLLMLIAIMISHVLRAERWRMLLAPSQNHITLSSSFLSLMTGYLINLVVPRGGEVSRCYNLYKLEKTPVEISFGTVVVERIVDVLFLVFFIALSFFAEWTKLKSFIDSLPLSSAGNFVFSPWMILIAFAAIGVFVLIYFLKKNEKFKKLITGFREGLLAIFRMKNKWLFIFYSVAIWCLYLLMSYLVLKAFEETASLGFSAVLTLFAIGSIAMALPLPGGAGSYHTLVPLGLVTLYNLDKSAAVAFVFIFHGWQTLITIIAGVISLLISYWIIRWKQQPQK
jgi:glycosyltransferase 2 family protein